MEASALQVPVGFARLSLSAPLLRLRSDDQLVALFRAGNEEAFRVIHDRYGLGRVVQLNTDRMNVKFGDVVIDIDTRSPKVHLL